MTEPVEDWSERVKRLDGCKPNPLLELLRKSDINRDHPGQPMIMRPHGETS